MNEEMRSNYHEDHCWQYDIRLKNQEEDINDIVSQGYTIDEIQSLSVGDMTFAYEEKSDVYQEVKEFIERHEWLGKMSLYPTHIFTARYNGILAGVVVMDMPAAFSKLLGEDTKQLERLISRGACVSWSPKNLASSLIMFSINWMVKNTQYRLFTAYSDPTAKELGTIYQACNFYYLGQKSGSKHQFKNQDGKWVSDRYFRCRSMYKRIAKDLGIEWDKSWQNKDRVMFDQMPSDIALAIKDESKRRQDEAERREIMPKHKYAYVKGMNKRETNQLRNMFVVRNGNNPYPKNRGLC